MTNHSSTTTTALEARVRRAARRDGQRLVKIRETSADYNQYGPYMLVDANTNSVDVGGLTLDDLDVRPMTDRRS
jgi:hypothetical protein